MNKLIEESIIKRNIEKEKTFQKHIKMIWEKAENVFGPSAKEHLFLEIKDDQFYLCLIDTLWVLECRFHEKFLSLEEMIKKRNLEPKICCWFNLGWFDENRKFVYKHIPKYLHIEDKSYESRFYVNKSTDLIGAIDRAKIERLKIISEQNEKTEIKNQEKNKKQKGFFEKLWNA